MLLRLLTNGRVVGYTGLLCQCIVDNTWGCNRSGQPVCALNAASKDFVGSNPTTPTFMANSNEYMKNYMREYSAKRRIKALEYLGGVCVKCGSKDGLEIHHIDPATKSFTLARGWHHAWAKVLKELDKCEILCYTCHKKHHKSNHPHGDVRRYWRGCKCLDCKAAFNKYQREWKKSKK